MKTALLRKTIHLMEDLEWIWTSRDSIAILNALASRADPPIREKDSLRYDITMKGGRPFAAAVYFRGGRVDEVLFYIEMMRATFDDQVGLHHFIDHFIEEYVRTAIEFLGNPTATGASSEDLGLPSGDTMSFGAIWRHFPQLIHLSLVSETDYEEYFVRLSFLRKTRRLRNPRA